MCTLFLSLTSCCRPCEFWTLEQSITPCPEYSSNKISSNLTDRSRGLRVELVRNECTERMYVNVYCSSIKPIELGKKRAEVIIAVDEIPVTFEGDLLEGNQRLLLPSEATALVIDSLLSGKEVIVATGRFQETLLPSNFGVIY